MWRLPTKARSSGTHRSGDVAFVSEEIDARLRVGVGQRIRVRPDEWKRVEMWVGLSTPSDRKRDLDTGRAPFWYFPISSNLLSVGDRTASRLKLDAVIEP
jgi:hypothetical protein